MKGETKMIGVRQGRLVVVAKLAGRRYVVRCDCGTEKEVDARNFYRTESCGCLLREVMSRPKKHGMTCVRKPPEFTIWCNMRRRCRDPRTKAYASYGGRGITVCERWNDFAAFMTDMGSRPSPKHSLDRIDNDGNYEPGNVRWATSKEQARNQRKTLRTEDGTALCDAADAAGRSAGAVVGRVRRGWNANDALLVPVVPRPMVTIAPGDRFGALTVIEQAPRPDGVRHLCYHARCVCGAVILARSSALKSGVVWRCTQRCKVATKTAVGNVFAGIVGAA